MSRNTRWLTSLIGALLVVALLWQPLPHAASQREGRQAGGAFAFQENSGMENYDIRNDRSPEAQNAFALHRQSLRPERLARASNMRQTMTDAQSRLARSVTGLEVIFSELIDAPKLVGVDVASRNFLTSSSTRGGEEIVRDFVNRNSSLYGLTNDQVAQLETAADYTNPAGNLSWVTLKQKVNGLPVFQGELRAALTTNGELVRTVGQLAPGLEYAELATEPAISAAEAVVSAAASIGVIIDAGDLQLKSSSDDGTTFIFEPGPFANDIKVELQYFPLEAGLSSLSWSIALWQDISAYHVIVDAKIGGLFYRQNVTNDQTQAATYSVYDSDSPAPLSPSPARPGNTIQGPGVPRTTHTIVSELPVSINLLGWIPDGANVTTGNNADAGLDRVSPNGIDPAGRAMGDPFRVFDFNYNPPPLGSDSPLDPNYQMGVVTNLFFWTNRYHDRLYELGFTEAARNFQQDNFGRGGLGNDHVLAEAQDFSGTNNANFSTFADGTSGRMQMYIWTPPFPDRDGDLDQEIIIHELTHGTSNRLHGPGGLVSPQGGGMGEGWGDFYAQALLSEPSDDVNGVYPMGGYSTIQLRGAWWFDNYYYGIRRFPRAVITSVGPNGRPHNPLTLADIDILQIDLSDGAYPPAFMATSAHQVHALGEIWCAALWEVRARLITRLGWAVGNQRMLQLVTDGMKLDPPGPTVLQARDAIIAADFASFGGEDVADVWAGFAARGMGVGATVSPASCPGTPQRCAVTESFATP